MNQALIPNIFKGNIMSTDEFLKDYMMIYELSTKELVENHNELVALKQLDNIYSIRMEIRKRTGSMDWDSGYKYLDLNPVLPTNEPKQKNQEVKMESKTSNEAVEVLKKCTIEGNVVKLPAGQLDRKIYMEVAKALELIGGKWKGGKIAGFVFELNPSDLLEQISNGEKRNLKKEYQFFATPSDLAEQLVRIADIKPTDTILEPSAGQGAIIKAINKVTNQIPDCYELMETNRMILINSGLKFNIVGLDFIGNSGKRYDKIIANPPFTKNQDIDHIEEMYKILNPGGRIVCIMSESWTFGMQKKQVAFREWLDDQEDKEIIHLERGTFKESGTSVGGVIVVLNKRV